MLAPSQVVREKGDGVTDEEACKAVIGAQPQRAETGRVDQISITQPRGFAAKRDSVGGFLLFDS